MSDTSGADRFASSSGLRSRSHFWLWCLGWLLLGSWVVLFGIRLFTEVNPPFDPTTLLLVFGMVLLLLGDQQRRIDRLEQRVRELQESREASR